MALDNGLLDLDFVLDHQQNLNDPICDPILQPENKVIENVSLGAASVEINRNDYALHSDIGVPFNNVSYNGIPGSSLDSGGDQPSIHTEAIMMETDCNTEVGNQTFLSSESNHLSDNESDFEELDLSADSHYDDGNPDITAEDVVVNKSSDLNVETAINSEVAGGKNGENVELVNDEDGGVEGGSEQNDFIQNQSEHEKTNTDEQDLTDAGHHEDGVETTDENAGNGSELGTATNEQNNDESAMTGEIDDADDENVKISKSNVDDPVDDSANVDVEHEDDGEDDVNDEVEADEGEDSMEEGEMEESLEDSGEHGYDIQPTDNEALSTEQQSGVPTVKPIFLKRKRKRRRKSASKRWSKSPVKKSGFTPSPYKRRRLSESITEENMDDSVGGEMLDKSRGVDEVTDDTLNDTAESTLSQGEDVDVETPEGKTRRTSRPPDRQDFFIDDDQLLEEMWKQTDPSALYHKKRKSLLFNRGRKARTVVEKPVTGEEKERYSLPFKEGWKREIVIRGTTKEDSGKKNPPSDVYYFPPFGTKLRSMVQLTDWLRKHSSKTSLTIDNFTFMRRPIGIEEGEIVRNANISKRLGQAFPKKKKPFMKDEDIHDDNDPLYDKPEIVIERDSDDFLAPIIADSINPQTNTSPLNNSFSKKGRPRKKIIVLPPPKKEIFADKPVFEMVHPSGDKCYIPVLNKSSKGTARKSTTPRIVKRPKPYTGVENLCSLKCPGLEDIPPLLHCNVCMCLFHDKCVRYFGDARKFTCLRCNTLKSPSQSDGSLVSPTTPEPMQLDPNLVKTLSKIPNGGQIHPPVNSNLLPTVIRSTPPPFRSTDGGNSTNVATTMPILAEKLQSKYTTSKGDNIEIIKSSVSDINMDLYIKEEPIDTSYPDPDVSVSEEEEEEKSTQTNVTSALSNYLHTKMITSTSQTYPPLHLKNSQQKQQPLKLGANSTPTLFTNNTLIRLPNSTYQLIPVGPPMPMPYNMRYPAAGQQQNVFTNVRPPGSLTSLSRLRAAQPPVPITSIRPTARPALSLLRTPSPVPLQLSTNNLLQLSTANSSLESSHSVSTSVTQTSWSKDSVVPPASPVVVNAKSCAPLNGQLLTLPPAAVKRLTLSKPLALKINNRQINVPPSGFFQTADGLKVFLPPNTFPFAEDNVVPGIETKSPDKSDSSSANDSGDKVESKTSDKEKTKYNLRASTRYQKLCFIKMLFGAYDCMEYIFKYLNLRDLISVGMVCRRWRTLAQNSSLWTNVNFNGMKVSDWKKAAQFMDRRQVKSMSLVGLEHYSDPHRTWHQLVSSSQDLQYLKKISFGVIPASVIHSLCSRLTRLESFYAEYIADPTPDSLQAAPTKIDIGKFACMTQLRELKIRGVHGLAPPSFSFSGGLMELGNLSDLEVLSVTSLHHVSEENFHFISQLLNIRELSLGNCTTWTQDTCERLGHLYGLEKLRLELGGEGCQNYIGEAIAHLKNLHTLELRAFPIAENLGSHLNCLKKLKKLVIYPPNTHNIARDNMNTLNAVTHLKRLKTLEWLLPDKKQLAIILDDLENAEEPENDLNSEYIPLLVTSSLSEDEEIVAAHTEYINAKELKERISQKLKNTTIYVKHCTVDDKMVGKIDK